ncbi:hypothetical protein WA158_000039 [Blastocystis sp. Blastoise]
MRKVVTSLHTLYTSCVQQYITISMNQTNNDIYKQYTEDIWLQNSLWLDNHTFWDKHLLTEGDDDEEDGSIEDFIYAPSQPSPSFLSLYIYICRQYSFINHLAIEYPAYLTKIRTDSINDLASTLLQTYTSIYEYISTLNYTPCTHGIIQIIYDIYILTNTLTLSSSSSQSFYDLLDQLYAYIDPIDWTLSQTYINKNVRSFVSSTSLLLSPLLPDIYSYSLNAVDILPHTDSLTFEATDRLPSYPLPTRPLQMVLQTYMKNNSI